MIPRPGFLKNVTLVNWAAFEELDKPTQMSVLKVAAAAEARGWRWSEEKTEWYMEQLAAHGMTVLPPSMTLKTGLQQVGERLTGEWLTERRRRRAGDNRHLSQADNVKVISLIRLPLAPPVRAA